eukprot:TRINITY_DN11135_c0_g1_i2.p1 TRINITY_DN11135_c0_g1~~TRINITY_DN11135_c0_g1_i2.p1  ORF type:complete len:252 (-),score=48.17 TRINITY_DN11135_c0_g1_i2:53-808(-)
MKLLGHSLKTWFDCFEDLERELGIDIKQTLTRQSASLKASARPNQPSVIDQVMRTSDDKFNWNREGGWYIETAPDEEKLRLVVICSAVRGRPFVSFSENGVETFVENEEPDLSGIFVKAVGSHCARHFQVPTDVEASNFSKVLDEALSSVSWWIESVPVQEAVMLACINVPEQAQDALSRALAPLGVPMVTPEVAKSCKAFAAVGVKPDRSRSKPGQSAGTTSKFGGRSDSWSACHASSDIAYAAMPAKKH